MLSTFCLYVTMACSGDAVPLPVGASPSLGPVVAAVVVSVDSAFLSVGSDAQATAIPVDRSGTRVSGREVTWVSGDPTIVRVASDGKVVAIGAGVGRVVATSEGVTGDALVRVSARPLVAFLEVSITDPIIRVGDTTRASALAFDSLGGRIGGRSVRWTIDPSTPGVATISTGGLLTPIAPGRAHVSGSSEGGEGGADLYVLGAAPTTAAIARVVVSLPSLQLTVGETADAVATPMDSVGGVLGAVGVRWSIEGTPGIATVSASGQVSALAPGTFTLVASIGAIRGTTMVDVVAPSSTGALVHPALPETLTFSFPRVTGRSRVVRAGDDLQRALDAAQRGDEIVLEAGATFVGNFRLPAKSGTSADGWVVVRSAAVSQLPPEGSRVGPSHAPLMPKVMTASTGPALATAPSANGWWISGIEFTVAPSVNTLVSAIVTMGAGGSAQRTLAQVPTDLVLDRVYIHPQSNQAVQRCLTLNSARTQVTDSYLFDCHAKGLDSQAILGWNGPGPFKIVNNMLAGAGENVMFGGADPSIPGLIPSDIEMRRNYVYTPLAWKGVWSKKNLIESKNAQRWLIEGNVLDGSWKDGQTGYALVLKVSSNSSTGGGCTWCVARDLTIRNNLIRNVGAGFGITGIGEPTMTVGERLNRVLIENNILEDVNVAPYVGEGRLVSIMNDAQNIVIRANTMTSTGDIGQFVYAASAPAATGFEFDGNVVTHGRYGLFSSKYGVGEASLKAFSGRISFRGNILVGNQRQGYPSARWAPSIAVARGLGGGANESRVRAATANVAIP